MESLKGPVEANSSARDVMFRLKSSAECSNPVLNFSCGWRRGRGEGRG